MAVTLHVDLDSYPVAIYVNNSYWVWVWCGLFQDGLFTRSTNWKLGFKAAWPQHAKKVMSDCPGLADFAVGLVNSVLNLPYKHIKLQKNCNQSCSSKNLLSKVEMALGSKYMRATQASYKTDFPCTLDLQLHVLVHFHFVSSPLLGGSIVPCLAKLKEPLLTQQSKNVLEVLHDICVQMCKWWMRFWVITWSGTHFSSFHNY